MLRNTERGLADAQNLFCRVSSVCHELKQSLAEAQEQRDRLAVALRRLRDEATEFVEGQNYSTGDQRGLVQTVNGAECVPLYDAIDFAGYALVAVEGGSNE